MEHKLLPLFTILLLTFVTVQGKVFHTNACEGHKMKLFCHSGDVIKVVHADYGRSNASICQYFDDPSMVLNCHSDTATAIVKQRCDGKLRCRVEATNVMFSDPCPGQIKYAEAKYKCVPKSIQHKPHHMARVFNHENGVANNKREIIVDVDQDEEADQGEESETIEEMDSSEEPEDETSDDEDQPKIHINLNQEVKYIPHRDLDAADIVF